ncbi:MAG: helix-turn-helix domain-containing protein [Burkholderiaceae bacterium]
MLRDLAAAAGMSAAKAHRYLVSFQRMGLVIQDPVSTPVRPGPRGPAPGLASLSRISAVKLARERMPALLTQTGHVLAIAVWGNQGTHDGALGRGGANGAGHFAPGRRDAAADFGHRPAHFLAFMGTEGRDAQRVGPMIRRELARLKKLPANGLPLVGVPQTPQAVPGHAR